MRSAPGFCRRHFSAALVVAISLLIGPITMSQELDPKRLEDNLRADADVVRALRSNGDIETIVRPVDVRFVGKFIRIQRLRREITQRGWRFIQIVESTGGEYALDADRQQKTDQISLRELTEAALKIEIEFGVRFDGWGTVAQRQ